MDIDFLLFNPPKRKINFMEFWGETIFIPKMRKRGKNESKLASFLNCYQASTVNEVHLTIDAALLESKGSLDFDTELSTDSSHAEEEQLDHHIPCLFLNSMVSSRYLILYFHSSGEDIKLSHKLLDLLRNLYQCNVLAIEYPGYSIYQGKPDSEVIKEDSQFVYNFVVNKLGFKEQDIIIMGRSIGTGVALELLQKSKPGALVLISPFASVKSLAREFAGFIGQLITKETYDNRTNLMAVSCPTFFLHGQKDQTISVDNTRELAKLCYQKNHVVLPLEMTHSYFDFYSDLADPLRDFLMANHFRFYEPNQQGPILPDHLFQPPKQF